MSNLSTRLLVVDDDPTIRMALSVIFAQIGYGVCTAHDGLSALIEIRREIPDVVISDLNMPRMSGFEFLSVVRRRFPAIQVIAMSGAFSGDGVPPGIAADAFYLKGSHPGFLLGIVEALSRAGTASTLNRTRTSAPIWIPHNGNNHAGEPYVMLTCTECLRSFAQVVGEEGAIHEACCTYCSGQIQYAIVQPENSTLPGNSELKLGAPLDLQDHGSTNNSTGAALPPAALWAECR